MCRKLHSTRLAHVNAAIPMREKNMVMAVRAICSPGRKNVDMMAIAASFRVGTSGMAPTICKN